MSVRIGMGIANFPFTDHRGFWRWIERCEDGDVDSIWQTDRLIGPQPFLESMSTMAALAGGTERLKFGMNVVVVPFRDPLVLAKECATIDFLSGGRMLPAFGVGGALAPEFRATSRPMKGRGGLADEALGLMVRLWAGETVTFAGQHYQYEEAVIAPLPVQDPLPLWIGGDSKAAIRRTATIGTGWLGGLHNPAQVRGVVSAIKQAAVAAGRTIDDDHYGASFAYRFGESGRRARAADGGGLAPAPARRGSRPRTLRWATRRRFALAWRSTWRRGRQSSCCGRSPRARTRSWPRRSV